MKDFFQSEIRTLASIRQFPWENARAYAQFLAQTYYYVCHTTRLLGLCASRIGVEREKLHHRFLKHAAEERSHHLLAERDISSLGFSLASIPELPLTAALYETQYFRAEHVGPTAIFGYILALEGVGVVYGSYVFETVKKHHGEAPCSFVKLHADEDPGHLDAAFAAVATLTEEEQRVIRDNFRFTCRLYPALLEAIRAELAI
jgi:hypothetical protein